MSDAALNESRALLTRAAELEAKRQLHSGRGDVVSAKHCEDELRKLWAAYVALQDQHEQTR